MIYQLYVFVGFLFLALTAALMWRRARAKPVDWELLAAFIRRDFPPEQRAIAQEIAAGLAEIVGLEIKLLRPEHTLKVIAQWPHDYLSISQDDLAEMFYAEYGVACDGDTTFRTIVEKVIEGQKEGTKPAA